MKKVLRGGFSADVIRQGTAKALAEGRQVMRFAVYDDEGEETIQEITLEQAALVLRYLADRPDVCFESIGPNGAYFGHPLESFPWLEPWRRLVAEHVSSSEPLCTYCKWYDPGTNAGRFSVNPPEPAECTRSKTWMASNLKGFPFWNGCKHFERR